MGFYSKITELAEIVSRLRVILFIFLCLILGLTFGLVSLALKDPILIERGCTTRLAQRSDGNKRSEAEIRAFLSEAITERVDSDHDEVKFLSEDERKGKESEQAELRKREIKQRFILESIALNSNEATIEGVRLFAIKELRSALRVKLLVKFAVTNRTEANPYGLLLISAQSDEKKENDKKGGGL